jgi:superfamily I DNA and/or RNA helicase/very-short-patch-repair endonuclease
MVSLSEVQVKLEKWKQKLLDLGKRNRLLNYKETRRSNVRLIQPDIDELYKITVDNNTLEFVLKDTFINLFNFDSELEQNKEAINTDINNISLSKGQVLTSTSDSELLKTLAQIRSKAKTAMEEQGVNILYLAFGFLEWTEIEQSSVIFKSPIVLVPVQLRLESLLDTYKLTIADDDIVINPTLLFKLDKDFNTELPSLPDEEGFPITAYLNAVQEAVKSKGWTVSNEVHLSLFSFLKLNMYEDLNNHTDKAAAHPIIQSLAGDISSLKPVPEELNDTYDHDVKSRPIDTFQVVDADSSQQDAIVAAKKGVSFVLQGPPGTGKSQTITNIIAECLSEGKKVLFVSEKMAALDVVYKRLCDTGLKDFCLQLHSHKANKKEVLSELGRTLALSKSHTRDEAIAELDQLLEERNHLNDYAKSLHTPCEPLGKTIYEIHGRLLRYQGAEDIRFDFDNVENVTQHDINKYGRLLEQFSFTANKLGSDYSSNPWMGCTLRNFTLKHQHDIMSHFNSFINILEKLGKTSSDLSLAMSLQPHNTLNLSNQFIQVLKLAGKSTKPPLTWVTTQEIEPLAEQAQSYLNITNSYHTTKEALTHIYDAKILDLESESLLHQMEKNLFACLESLNRSTINEDKGLIEKREWLTKSLTTIETLFQDLKGGGESLSNILGVPLPYTINELESVCHLTKDILLDPKPTSLWFDNRQFKITQKLLNETRSKYKTIEENEKKILQTFSQQIFDLDCNSLLLRFKTKYSSILRLTKVSYYKDRKSLIVLKKETSKISNADIISYLELIRENEDLKKWLSEHNSQISEVLGSWYNHEYTDWDSLTKAINTFDDILNWFAPGNIPSKAKDLLLNIESSIQSIKKIFATVNKLMAETETINLVHKLFELDSDIKETTFEVVIEKVKLIFDKLEQVFYVYDKVTSYMVEKRIRLCRDIIKDLTMVSTVRKSIDLINTKFDELREAYGYYFSGIDTNWQEVLDSLAWSLDFRQLINDLMLPLEFTEKVCTKDEIIALARKGLKEFEAIELPTSDELNYLTMLFEEDEHDFKNMEFTTFQNWLQTCVSNFGALEEWIDFVNSREQCLQSGLGNYIETVIASKLPAQTIVPSFFNRFYRLWLDAMYERFPAIVNFRRRNHESIIDSFKELDKKQLIIARARIRETLFRTMPSTGSIYSGRGEIDILRHELGKRKKIKPLRKLFHEIPNLLLTLKPCLMMSPLSVSLFLEPESYDFDVVLFDEASQICPEDSIGAIFRAKQVIIAGDSEQLPPTNFFSVSTGDSEYDEDEDNEVDAYESILDESRAVLPEKSLRWHYRSKHEHLIAFSNVKIYAPQHNSLITFPSSIERAPNNGVEYIYVQDGVYDRSGSRSNKIEAQKVAQLVFEHWSRFPRRSLGIVTFSQAQQNEVEAAVRHMRGINPQFEMFFDESNDEPFFIKNLENVQGDERDTIIFSIGYAKDTSGVMYMNFGPLSKSGGYRRLNVAITRAKYNIKLVGSIKPTDIDLDRTGSDGVKMLRSYIDFAINGPDSLLRETVEPETVNTESPFEEEVYSFLKNKGYHLATQVGCSRYRIDMAIKHPKVSGKYVIGIECDGATYHSARTARERDRLREDVLRGLGWKLHRIWSTDWIKDPMSEGQRLTEAIEEAIYNADDFEGNITAETENFISNEVMVEEIIEKLEEECQPDWNNFLSAYGFIEYKPVDLNLLERHVGEKEFMYICRLIRELVENEGPIHFDVLSKRLAFLFGREKVTSKVKKSVMSYLKAYLRNEIVIRDEFCWFKEVKYVTVKVPNSTDGIRKIEHICKEELAEAMYTVAKNRFGMSSDDLIMETSRIFGFNRAGGKIKDAMSDALVHLVNSNRISEKEGKVIAVI